MMGMCDICSVGNTSKEIECSNTDQDTLTDGEESVVSNHSSKDTTNPNVDGESGNGSTIKNCSNQTKEINKKIGLK